MALSKEVFTPNFGPIEKTLGIVACVGVAKITLVRASSL